MQEMTELRSEYVKHFLAEDGRRVAELYTYPVHYLDRDTQAWEDSTYLIELDEAVEGFSRNMKAAPFRVRFGADRVRFGFAEGKYITYQFQGANVITPVFEAHKATFAGLYLQTDVVYSILSKELKQEIVLLDATAPASFNVLLDGNVIAELVDNAIVFKDGETVVGGIPAPFAIDAEGNRGAVTFALDESILTITTDTSWLATAVYPVVIDPTTTIQPDATAGKDSYITSANPSVNTGTNPSLISGWQGDLTDAFRSLLQFDISSIVNHIESAILQLYCHSEGSSNDYNVTAHKITASWTETGVNWTNQPAYTATPEDTEAITGISAWFSWDISSLTQDWQSGAVTNNGIMLVGNESATAITHKSFYSSDYTTDASLTPKLVIVYDWNGPTVSTPASTTQATPTGFSNEITPQVAWSVDGLYTQKAAQVQIYDSNSNLVYDSGTIAGAGTTHNVATGYLEYGKTYGVRVRCQDNATDYWSEWSVLHYLQCVMTAPAGLTATADATHAEIDLAWTAHAGENLAGYRVYRKLSTASTYTELKNLVTTNSHSDRITASGVTYDYKVAAVATDGYESPLSVSAQSSVTVSATWIDAVQVPLRSIPVIGTPRRASSRIGTDGSYITQDLGLLPRTATFVIAYSTKALRDTYLAMFTASHIFDYRGPDGETFRGKVIGTITESRFNLPPSQFVGDLSFEAVEVD